LVSNSHDGGEDSHDHLVLNLNEILREGKNGGTNLAGHGNGVLGILHLVDGGGGAVDDEIVADGAVFDRINEIDDGEGGGDVGVLEGGDGGALSVAGEGLVDPGDNLVIGDAPFSASKLVEDGEGMSSHHLPDDGEGEGLASIEDILSVNSDQGELHLLSELEGVVAVLDLLHVASHLLVRGLVDTVPVDDAGLDLVEELDEDKTVTEILVEVVNEGVDTKGVHPVAVSLLLAGLLDNLDLDRLEGGAGVEHVGDEGKVELGVTLGNVSGADELAALNLVGLLQHSIGALNLIGDSKGRVVNSGLGRSALLDQNGVGLRVLDVLGEIVDAPGRSGLGKVVVDPSEKDLLNGKGHELFEGFVSLKEAGKPGNVGKIDAGEKSNLNKEEKDHLAHQIYRTDKKKGERWKISLSKEVGEEEREGEGEIEKRF